MIAPVSSSTSPLGLAPIGTLVRPAAVQTPPAGVVDPFSPSTIVSLGNRPDSPVVYDAAGLLGPLSLLSPPAARRAAQSDQALRSALERAIELGLIPAADASSLGIDPPFSTTEPQALDPALRAALAAHPDLAGRLFGDAADVDAGTIDLGADEVAALSAGVLDAEPLRQANPAADTVAAGRSAAAEGNDDGSAPETAANATSANPTSTDATQADIQDSASTATDPARNGTAAQDQNNPMAPRPQIQTTETVTVRQALPQQATVTQQAVATPQVTGDPAYAGIASAFYLSALAAQMQANRPVTTGIDSPLAVAPARPVRRIEPAQPVASGRSAR